MNLGKINSWDDVRQAVAMLGTGIDQSQRWRLLQRDAAYASVPVTPSILRVRDSSWFTAGTPLRWTVGQVAYYGLIVRAPTVDSVEIAGPAVPATGIDSLAVGRPELVVQRKAWVPGAFGGLTNSVIHYYANSQFERPVWAGPPAYLVDSLIRYAIIAKDGGGQPATVNPYLQLVLWYGAATLLVVTPSFEVAMPGPVAQNYHVRPPLGSIDPTAYRIELGWHFDLRCVTPDNGVTHAAALSGVFTFVLE